MKFLEAIAGRAPLLADGATGTWLQAAGLPVGEPPERWVLENPAAVGRIAAEYVAAGSELVYTCTFGATRVQMRRCGLDERVEEINRRAVELVRAAGPRCVVGSIGPTGELVEPYGELGLDEAHAAFAGQAASLAAAGADVLACETFMDLSEALVAVAAARATQLPVIASMAFDTNGRTMMGVTPEEAVARLSDAGAVVVGANCSVGPDVVERVLRAMRAARPDTPLLAKPNAGLPQVRAGNLVYPDTPDMMAGFARRMAQLGAAIVGGCCGTTPDHVRAMRRALEVVPSPRPPHPEGSIP